MYNPKDSDFEDHEPLSLVQIMSNKPWEFDQERFKKVVDSVEKDLKNLTGYADEYNRKHEEEIEEGTKKSKLLITEGLSKGLTEDESLQQYGKFLPSRRTPILNFLYFMLRDEVETPVKLQEKTKEISREYGYEEILTTMLNEVSANQIKDLDEILSKNIHQPKELINFIFEEATIDIFNKIKKLKALSRSPNVEEGFSAYKKCLELCKKYHLEFDRIPCDVQ